MITSNCEVSIRITSHFVTAPFRDVSNVTGVLSVASRRDVSNVTYIFRGLIRQNNRLLFSINQQKYLDFYKYFYEVVALKLGDENL